MRDLGTLPGYDLGSVAQAINDRGQIVGESSGGLKKGRHAFLWQNGKMRDLGTLGGGSSFATAINNGGQVVGTSTTKDGSYHAFLWQNGRMRDLGEFNPAAINDRGQVVGSGRLPGRSAWRAWHARLWENGIPATRERRRLRARLVGSVRGDGLGSRRGACRFGAARLGGCCRSGCAVRRRLRGRQKRQRVRVLGVEPQHVAAWSANMTQSRSANAASASSRRRSIWRCTRSLAIRAEVSHSGQPGRPGPGPRGTPARSSVARLSSLNGRDAPRSGTLWLRRCPVGRGEAGEET